MTASDSINMKTYLLTVGITGSCNLRCPSCAAGNMPEINRPGQYMSVDTYRDVLKKATSESRISAVCLFITTEPLLHPHLNEIIRVTNSFNIPCMISTNLNLLPRDVDDFFAANPASLRVSLSGYFQETYERTHRGGRIDRVKENIKIMADAWKRAGSKSHFEIHYHRYIGNLDEEILMKRFAKELGLEFTTNWAGFHPYEKHLSELEPDSGFPAFTDEDRALLQILPAVAGPSIKESIFYQENSLLKKYNDLPCTVQSAYLFVDWRGQTQLCCAMGDTEKFSLGSYLDMPLGEIQGTKDKHEICRICKKNSGHVIVSLGYQDIGSSYLDSVCMKNILDYYASEGYDLRQGMIYDKSAEASAVTASGPSTHVRDHQSEYNGLVELLKQQLAEERSRSAALEVRIAELERGRPRKPFEAPPALRDLGG